MNTKKPSLISRSRVKTYALRVSAEKRAGKFTRVSEDFLQSVEADFNAAIRQIFNTDQWEVLPAFSEDFVTPLARSKTHAQLNPLVAMIIHRKVMRHPTVGVTLK